MVQYYHLYKKKKMLDIKLSLSVFSSEDEYPIIQIIFHSQQGLHRIREDDQESFSQINVKHQPLLF